MNFFYTVFENFFIKTPEIHADITEVLADELKIEKKIVSNVITELTNQVLKKDCFGVIETKRIKNVDYIIARTGNGVVIQKNQDWNDSKHTGLYISLYSSTDSKFTGNDRNIFELIKEMADKINFSKDKIEEKFVNKPNDKKISRNVHEWTLSGSERFALMALLQNPMHRASSYFSIEFVRVFAASNSSKLYFKNTQHHGQGHHLLQTNIADLWLKNIIDKESLVRVWIDLCKGSSEVLNKSELPSDLDSWTLAELSKYDKSDEVTTMSELAPILERLLKKCESRLNPLINKINLALFDVIFIYKKDATL